VLLVGGVYTAWWVGSNQVTMFVAPSGSNPVTGMRSAFTISALAGATAVVSAYAGGNGAGDIVGYHMLSMSGTMRAELWTDAANATTRLKSAGALAFHTGNTGFTGTNQWMYLDAAGALTLAYAGGVSTAPTIQIANGAFVNGKTSAGVTQPMLAVTGDDYNAFYCGPNGVLWTNYNNTTRIGYIYNDGTAQFTALRLGPTGATANIIYNSAARMTIQNELGITSGPVGSNGVLLSCHGNLYGGVYYSTTSQFLGWRHQSVQTDAGLSPARGVGRPPLAGCATTAHAGTKWGEETVWSACTAVHLSRVSYGCRGGLGRTVS
jgi:hypothetical protein